MGTPLRASGTTVVSGTRLVLAALLIGSSGVAVGVAAAQSLPAPEPRITRIAAATTGAIIGIVRDDRGQPLDGVVVSAMGGSTSFAVSGRGGEFTLRSLTPGPYLVRAHLDGYLPARNTMVNVRPSSETISTFTLRRTGSADAPRVTTAGVAVTEVAAVPESGAGRDESETAWRLRHLKRSILKDTTTFAGLPADSDFFLTDSLQLLGRAVENSARMAGALFAHAPLQGQVNLLTTGVFDDPSDFLHRQRTRGVAFFSVGAPVGGHGDWAVKAALNHGDLSSWILAGDYVTRAPARHRYQFGMSYGLQRYEGGNAAALAAMPDAARNVGAVYAHDEWRVTPGVTVGYGAHFAHYDYLWDPAHFSPRLTATFQQPGQRTRMRAVAARHVVAPGAEEFLPPSGAAHVLPPQRTFAPLTPAGFLPEDMRHYEFAFEQVMDGATVGVRAFYQSVDDQLVTVFGLRELETAGSELGHYSVGSSGDVDVMGVGVTYSHALVNNVRGSVGYSLAAADWDNSPSRDRLRLARSVRSALRPDGEHIHDLTATLETELPRSFTRIVMLYKLNSAYARADQDPGLAARWDLQVSQALPFLSFTRAEWEMLMGVRTLFRDAFTETSVYDELLVVRPPKRLVGGITVKF